MRNEKTTGSVDAILARAARDDALPEGLMARVLADAARQQGAHPTANAPRRWSFGRRPSWPALGGLVAAGCAGFWIGASSPELLSDPAAALLGSGVPISAEDTVEVFAFGWDIDDG